MTTTFEQLQIELRAQELYAAQDRLMIPWSRRREEVRRLYRDAAKREMALEALTAEAEAMPAGAGYRRSQSECRWPGCACERPCDSNGFQ